MYEIEKGIDIPPKSIYPFHNMKIGDSFPLAAKEKDKVNTAMHAFAKKNGGKFTLRVINGEARCWRVE